MIQAWLLKQAPLIVISLTVIGAGLWVGHSLVEHGRNEVRPMLDKALSERDNLAATLENERAERRRAEEAVGAYSKEIASLRRRPRSEPVRVCFDEQIQCPPPAQPPAILMESPPSPGAFQERLEAILKPSASSRTNATK